MMKDLVPVGILQKNEFLRAGVFQKNELPQVRVFQKIEFPQVVPFSFYEPELLVLLPYLPCLVREIHLVFGVMYLVP